MKKCCLFLVMVMLIGMLPAFASAEGEYGEAPMLTEMVANGELPSVEERLPLEPEVYNDAPESLLEPEEGIYGGRMDLMSTVVSWNADAFIMMYESMLTVDFTNNEIYSNVVDCTVNEDATVFTFTIPEGMRWSDGEYVTTEDVAFCWNDFINNEVLTPAISSTFYSGKDAGAELMVMEIVDDYTFTLTSSKPYGGLLIKLSAAGWPVYSDWIKPAHYLKPFHIDYAEECHGSLEAYYEYITPIAEKLGYYDPTEEGVWMYVFNAVDMTQWEITDPADALAMEQYPEVLTSNCPCLNPWIMESASDTLVTWVRNPYYWKVDQWGNQLPYLDYVYSAFMENSEMFDMNVIAGNIDMTYSSLDSLPLYREQAADIVENYLTEFTGLSCILFFNMNYDEDPSFVEAMQYPDFRKALGMAIDTQEIGDACYVGEVTLSRQAYTATYDVDAANDLLDELGFIDVNDDGWRETPSGLEIAWNIYPQVEGGYVKPCELMVENFGDIGVKMIIQSTDPAYWSTLISSNSIPMLVSSSCEAPEWRQDGWRQNYFAPLYWSWWQTRNSEEANGIEPTEEFKRLYTLIDQTLELVPTDVDAIVIPQIIELVDENAWYLTCFESVGTGFTVNKNFGNVSETDPNSQYREVYGELYFDRTAAD